MFPLNDITCSLHVVSLRHSRVFVLTDLSSLLRLNEVARVNKSTLDWESEGLFNNNNSALQ